MALKQGGMMKYSDSVTTAKKNRTIADYEKKEVSRVSFDVVSKVCTRIHDVVDNYMELK